MTNSEKNNWKKLEKKLYGRGLTFNDWDKLVALRTKHLIARGENPKHWNLDSKNFSKKLHYRIT